MSADLTLGALLAAAFAPELSPTKRRRCIDISLGILPPETRVADSENPIPHPFPENRSQA